MSDGFNINKYRDLNRHSKTDQANRIIVAIVSLGLWIFTPASDFIVLSFILICAFIISVIGMITYDPEAAEKYRKYHIDKTDEPIIYIKDRENIHD